MSEYSLIAILMDPATQGLLSTIMMSTTLVALASLALYVLPWTDDELIQVEASAVELGARLKERLYSGEQGVDSVVRHSARS